MTTSNSTNDPKTAKSDEARIKDLPEPKDAQELTPDEEMSIVGGGCTTVNNSKSNHFK